MGNFWGGLNLKGHGAAEAANETSEEEEETLNDHEFRKVQMWHE